MKNKSSPVFAHPESKYLINLFLCIALFIILFSVYTPIFETNDDIGMSMLAHGYGGSLFPSAHIMFSNVIYGWIVSNLPTIGGIYPYSYMTFIALIIAAYALLISFEALAVNKTFSIVLITMILIRAVSMPQFSVNAGILAIASAVSLFAYDKTGAFKFALFGFILAWYSYLIRRQELIFVYIVALPFLMRAPFFQRKFIIGFIVLIAGCILASYINFLAYQGSSYAHYNALLKVRIPFNDYGAAQYFIQRPEILTQFGYSENDVHLLANFIFADFDLANPERMGHLLDHFKITSRVVENISLTKQALKSIFSPSFRLFLVLAFLGVFFSNNRKRLLVSWSIFIACIVVLGLLGRPSIERIYYPIIAFLTIIPFLNLNINTKHLKYFVGSVLIIIALVIAHNNQIINHERLIKADLASSDLKQLDTNKTYFVFGASFPFEYADLPFRPLPKVYKFIIFGCEFYIPNTRAYQLAFSDNSFSSMEQSAKPMDSIMTEMYLPLRKAYCKEHFNKKLHVLSTKKLNTLNIYTTQCSVV